MNTLFGLGARALFPLGQVVATPGALDALATAEQSASVFLRRHVTGDWGNVCEEDAQENKFSLEHDFRLVSAYTLESGVMIWLITEANRSVTTFLLPSEY